MWVNGSQGTDGQVLTSQGSGTVPQWETASGGTAYHRFTPEESKLLTATFPQLVISTYTSFPVSSLNYDATISTETAHCVSGQPANPRATWGWTFSGLAVSALLGVANVRLPRCVAGCPEYPVC